VAAASVFFSRGGFGEGVEGVCVHCGRMHPTRDVDTYAPPIDPDQVRKLLEQGFLFFQTRTELGLMTLGARQILDPFGKTPKSGKSCTKKVLDNGEEKESNGPTGLMT
jgi:hypothetical protein